MFNYALSGALALGLYIQANLANSRMRLFKQGFVPSPTATRADFVAQEVNFDGYPPAGLVIAAWSNPLYYPGGGAAIESGLQQFAFAGGGPGNTNVVAGLWIEDGAGTLIGYSVFVAPVTVAMVGQGVPANVLLPFGANT